MPNQLHHQKKNLLVNLLLLSVSTLLCFIILELALRYFCPVGEGDRLMQFHPVCGWTFKPNAEAVIYTEQSRQQKHLVKINSRGWRDFEELAPGKENIVVLGDSFTSNIGLKKPENVITEILESKLKNYNIINLGVDGFGTGQEYFRLVNDGMGYQPQVVLLLFYIGNDFYDNIGVLDQFYSYKRPHFDYLDNEIKIIKPAQETIRASGSLTSLLLNSHAVNFFITRSSQNPFVEKIVKNNQLVKNLLNRLGLLTKTSPEEWDFAKLPPEVQLYKTDMEKISHAYELTCQILTKMNDELQKKSIPLYVFLAPTISQIRDDYFDILKENYDLTDKARFFPNEQLQRCGKANQIEIIDLTPNLQEIENQHNTPYLHFKQDRHWSEKGNKAAAEIMYNYLKEKIN